MVNQATNIQQNFKTNLKKTKNIFKITLEDIFLNCKIHNSPSEGSAKDERRMSEGKSASWRRRVEAVQKVFKSMIAPHTLANFQSLPKLITLIINHFYSHCRGDWQIALTKQNFSDTLIQNSQFKIHNSKFTIQNSKFTIQNSQFTIQNSKFKIQN